MKTILLADDDKNIRLLLEAELTLEGYRVILASIRLEALKRTREKNARLTNTGFENARYV